jgi:hypothetical protein
MQRIFKKKCFLFTVGSVVSHKTIHNCVEKRGIHFTDDKEVEMEVQKWLRPQSKDFCAVGFDVLVKRWDKCIRVGGGYVKK